MTFGKNIDLIQFFLSYLIWIMIKYTTLVCPGAGAGAKTSVYRLQLGSGQKFRLRPAPAPQPW